MVHRHGYWHAVGEEEKLSECIIQTNTIGSFRWRPDRYMEKEEEEEGR